MSGRLTVWGAGQLLTSYFSRTALVPESLWLALVCLQPPDPYMDGTELDEPDADDYVRLEIPNDTLNWSNEATTQEIVNLQPAQWPTAATDWGMVNYWALCNASEGGNNILIGDLESALIVSSGDQAVLSDGDLSLTLGPFFLVDEL